MAKIVIAGSSDCPYFAKIELLSDCLVKNLPNFKVHKIVKTPETWKEWLAEECSMRGWKHQSSPLIWRELVDRGGKGAYIGGANDFQEYVKSYYHLKSMLTSGDVRLISSENLATKIEVDKEEAAFKALSNPLRIAVTNSNSSVCYALLNRIACGEVFGPKEEVCVMLAAETCHSDSMKGLEMEAEDMAHGLLRGITFTPNLHQAFSDCSVILLLDEPSREENEETEVYVKRRGEHFKRLGKIIQETARRDVKVIVANDGTLNLDTLMVLKGAPSISRHNIVGLSRTVENHAKAVIGERLKVNSSAIRNLVVWGNVNGNSFLDVSQARVHGYEGAIWGPPSFSLPVPEMVHDQKWLETDFITATRSRRQTVEEATGHRASMSDAASIATLLQHWWFGSPLKEIFSVAIYSQGWYNFPEDLVISLPVTFDPKGYWHVVQDIELTMAMKAKIDDSIQEARTEKEIIFPPPPKPEPVKEDSVTEEKAAFEEKPASSQGAAEADQASADAAKEGAVTGEETEATQDKEKTAEDNAEEEADKE